MATGGEDPDQLTRKQIVRLAAAISANNLAAIAEGYMDIDDVTIKNLQYENKEQAQAFNRDVIKYWICKNQHNRVKVCLHIPTPPPIPSQSSLHCVNTDGPSDGQNGSGIHSACQTACHHWQNYKT